MTDEAQTPVETPAATPPVATVKAPDLPPDIQALLDSRVAGVQSAFERRLNAELAQRDAIISELKTATLSEDEREQLAQEDRDNELENLRLQLWLANQAQKNPKAAEVYRTVLESDDPDAAFAVFESLVAAQTATPAPPEPETLVPDVDPNNPNRHQTTGVQTFTLPDGTVLTDKIADDILKGMTRWPER